MGHSQAEKSQTHDELVRIAAKRFRELGLDGLSIANLMNEAGLTQGGFYKHFASRESLLLEALVAAFKDGEAPRKRKPGKSPSTPSFGAVVEDYLSESHRDDPGSGCAVGALMSDVGRAGFEARKLYTEQVERNFQLLERLLAAADSDAGRMRAIIAYSAMTGSLGLARAVSNKKLSNEILSSVRKYLNDEFQTKS